MRAGMPPVAEGIVTSSTLATSGPSPTSIGTASAGARASSIVDSGSGGKPDSTNMSIRLCALGSSGIRSPFAWGLRLVAGGEVRLLDLVDPPAQVTRLAGHHDPPAAHHV